jgi:uncharacterized membrane protein YkoI
MNTRKILTIAGAIAALGIGAGVALAGNGSSGPSRLDDGKDLRPQAKLTEQQAIQAAQTAASGAPNEVDLEHYQGRLVWNVDVGAYDVKVDDSTSDVVARTKDD